MRVITSEQSQYKIQVADLEPQQLDGEGRVSLHIPGFCVKRSYIFGIKFSGDDPWREPIIKIVRDGTLQATVSIRDIEALAKDESGYHKFKQ
jgi:hypothetical protein